MKKPLDRSTGLGLGLLLVATLALAGCGTEPDQGAVEFRVPVVAEDVELGDVEDRVVVTGDLRAPERALLTIETPGLLRVARAAGRRLAEGDRVRAGQLIAEVTGEDARLAAQVEATARRLETARQELESRRRLHEEGLISLEELRRQETVVSDRQTDWEQSRLTETRTRVTTPISGVLLRLGRDTEGLPIADGQLVARGTQIATVAPDDSLIAEVDLLGLDLARVEPGLEARVRHFAWTESFVGRLARLAPTLDPVTRAVKAEVEVDNRDGRLRPGMFVEVTLVVERREGVPVVPRDAVGDRAGQKVVFVLAGQRVAQRQVTLGLGDDERVEIRQGVERGERVVTQGIETLTDGTRVRVSEGS